ncbi:chorismate mutase [Actinopolyspora xinjiangensis]|uniref:chorismate mutase n=1 Tax=Actinopolyspora xinjiangensis TaxID=405564 RepID=UPI0014817B13|nr:chorismate mutase [Actinopolyspora xinjiangensis]
MPLASLGLALPAATESENTDFGPLVRPAAERLAVADQVAAAKYESGDPVEAPAREREVLAEVSEHAERAGLDPAVATEVFRDRIEANKLVQRCLISRWESGTTAPPRGHPDMDDVRDRTDEINQGLLDTLLGTKSVRHDPGCRAELTRTSIRAASRLDALHARALGRGLHSVCR